MSRIGPVASGGFGALLREAFVAEVQDREFWWERHYPEPVADEAANMLKFVRAAGMIAARHAKNPRWKFAGFTYEDIHQVAWIGVLIGLRSWHKRPPQCRSLLAWCIRNADWFCARQRDIATTSSTIRRIPRLVAASVIDAESRDGDDHHGTFDQIVAAKLEQTKRREPEDLSLASLGISILRKTDRHRLADILEARIFDQLTLQQIGDQIGCSCERVRQLEADAARRLAQNEEWREAAKSHWPNWVPAAARAAHDKLAANHAAQQRRLRGTPDQPLTKKSPTTLAHSIWRARRNGLLSDPATSQPTR